MTYRTQGRPESTNIEDHRPDDQFFEALTPHFKPSADQVQSVPGASKAAQDDATSILNDMFTGQRSAERDWVQKKNMEDWTNQKDTYIGWKQDQLNEQYNRQNQFLLETFKRARQGGLGSVIAPYLNTFVTGGGYGNGIPSAAFEGQAHGGSKAIEHSKDQSMNTGTKMTEGIGPGWYDLIPSDPGEAKPFQLNRNNKNQIDKANDNKRLRVVT